MLRSEVEAGALNLCVVGEIETCVPTTRRRRPPPPTMLRYIRDTTSRAAKERTQVTAFLPLVSTCSHRIHRMIKSANVVSGVTAEGACVSKNHRNK